MLRPGGDKFMKRVVFHLRDEEGIIELFDELQLVVIKKLKK